MIGILAGHLPGLECIIRKRGSIDFSPAKLYCDEKHAGQTSGFFPTLSKSKELVKMFFFGSFIKAKLERVTELEANILKSSMIPNT